MKRMKKRKITVLAGVILCVIAGCLVKRMTAVYTQKENPIGPERGTTDVFLTAADFISEKSDQELLQEIETFDTDKAEMIYLYIPEDTGAGMSFAITREDHPEEMDEILSTIYGEKISCQKPKQVFNMTERILYDYNWYVLIYDHEMNQMALVFLYSDDVIVYNGHVLQTTETYDESIRLQITLKRNASSATAELLFHFLRYEVPLDDIILFHAYLYRSFPDDMYDVYL